MGEEKKTKGLGLESNPDSIQPCNPKSPAKPVSPANSLEKGYFKVFQENEIYLSVRLQLNLTFNLFTSSFIH